VQLHTDNPEVLLLTVGMLGAGIGVGKLLAGKEPLTWRTVVGRALSSAGLALASGAALALFPGLPMPAIIGISALLASLGTSAIERLAFKYVGKGDGQG